MKPLSIRRVILLSIAMVLFVPLAVSNGRLYTAVPPPGQIAPEVIDQLRYLWRALVGRSFIPIIYALDTLVVALAATSPVAEFGSVDLVGATAILALNRMNWSDWASKYLQTNALSRILNYRPICKK